VAAWELVEGGDYEKAALKSEFGAIIRRFLTCFAGNLLKLAS
jgi:hypothetical protein